MLFGNSKNKGLKKDLFCHIDIKKLTIKITQYNSEYLKGSAIFAAFKTKSFLNTHAS